LTLDLKRARAACATVALCAAALTAQELAYNTADEFNFFSREASVAVSASRRADPSPVVRAPGTVYVLTAEDLRRSGAQTVPDALRAVPGVDVASFRTGHQEVSIRGLNKASNNRTLVMVDGRTVLNSFFDYLSWEGIPVTLEEIDRIEVVEGPVSAVYGSNAVSGAINIITRTPEQISGGEAGYAGGERGFHRAGALAGGKTGRVGAKASAAHRAHNEFEDADETAARVTKGNASVFLDAGPESRFAFSGGASNRFYGHQGRGHEDGAENYLRGDYRFRNTQVRTFWNHGDFGIPDNPGLPFMLRYDTYDVNVDQSIALPAHHNVQVGAGYRRNQARSNLLPPGDIRQDLWSVFLEDQWTPAPAWVFVLGGRMDRHPFTRWNFSPRGSVIYSPRETHSFRLSGGSSYRNPTIFENYVNLDITAPGTPPFTQSVTRFRPTPTVEPEIMSYGEIAHRVSAQRFRSTLAVFRYELKDLVAGETRVVSNTPPTQELEVTVTNRGKVRAWGGEAGLRVFVTRRLDVFANYSYQDLRDRPESANASPSSPENKVNAGVRYAVSGVTANVWTHWVDRTYWPLGSTPPLRYERVDDYALVNAAVFWAVPRREGLELGVQGFNIGNNKHYEVRPGRSPFGERIGTRWTGSVSYRF
jgi:iron complex outermembrane recepter protein